MYVIYFQYLYDESTIFVCDIFLKSSPLRFNPSRIDSIEMTLAAVMNGKGNGNKDEVSSFQYLEISLLE